jgi:hypothetical protein
MPKPGYKFITVSENVYKKFFEVYEKNKKGLELKGIGSFSGYLTSMMEEMMIKDEVFAKHSPFIEKIAVDQDRVILKDNKRNRIVEDYLAKLQSSINATINSEAYLKIQEQHQQGGEILGEPNPNDIL